MKHHPEETARAKRLDKQYWVLCAIYRMTRVNQWRQDVASRLLHERAKYSIEEAGQITSIWFGHGKSKTLPNGAT